MTEKQLMKCGDGLAEWVEKSVGEGVKADDVIGMMLFQGIDQAIQEWGAEKAIAEITKLYDRLVLDAIEEEMKAAISPDENMIDYTCRKMGLTQKNIAEVLGVSAVAVSRWRTGKDKIPPARMDELTNLANMFECDYS